MAKAQKVTKISTNQAVAVKLYKLLADSYSALLQTQSVHWNYEGDNFFSVHKLAEQIYDEQFTAIDEIAERLRAIGQKIDANFTAFNKTSSVKNASTVKDLIAVQTALAESCQDLINETDSAEDKVTEDLAIGRKAVHDKNIWLLKTQGN